MAGAGRIAEDLMEGVASRSAWGRWLGACPGPSGYFCRAVINTDTDAKQT